MKWQGKEPEFLLAPMLSDAQWLATPGVLPPDEFMRRFEIVSTGKSLPASSSYKQFVIDYVVSHTVRCSAGLVAGELLNGHTLHRGTGPDGRLQRHPPDRIGRAARYCRGGLSPDESISSARGRWSNSAAASGASGTASRRHPALVRAMQGLRAETLNATFGVIDTTYGSFDTFRREALNVSDAELKALRDRLLEPYIGLRVWRRMVGDRDGERQSRDSKAFRRMWLQGAELMRPSEREGDAAYLKQIEAELSPLLDAELLRLERRRGPAL